MRAISNDEDCSRILLIWLGKATLHQPIDARKITIQAMDD